MRKRLVTVSALLTILLLGVAGTFVAVQAHAAPPRAGVSRSAPTIKHPTTRLTSRTPKAPVAKNFAQNAAYLKTFGKTPTPAKPPTTTPLTCHPITSGFFTGATAAFINPSATVTGAINASACTFAVYVTPGHSATVDSAYISGSYYGVVGDGASITITNTTITGTFLAAGIGSDGANTATAQISNATLIFNGEAYFAAPIIPGSGTENGTLTNVNAAGNFFTDALTESAGSLTVHGGQYNGGVGVLTFEAGFVVNGGTTLTIDSNAQVTGNDDSGVIVNDSDSSANLDHVIVSTNTQDTTGSHIGGVLNYGRFYARYSVFGNDGGLVDALANAGLMTIDDSAVNSDDNGLEDINQAQITATKFDNTGYAAYTHLGARTQLSLATITHSLVGVFNGSNDTANDGSVTSFIGSSSVTGALAGIVNYANLAVISSKADNNGYGLFNGQFAAATVNFSELLNNSIFDVFNESGGVINFHLTTFVTHN